MNMEKTNVAVIRVRAFLTVFLKEVKENLRDRRTLVSAFLTGPLLGPLILVMMLNLTLNREFDKADLFRTQDEITREIVSALPGRIEAHWLEGSRRKRAENFVAYDYVLKAWDLLYEQGGDQHTAIRSLVQQAIFLQPG